jgi:hypothetical protein
MSESNNQHYTVLMKGTKTQKNSSLVFYFGTDTEDGAEVESSEFQRGILGKYYIINNHEYIRKLPFSLSRRVLGTIYDK